MEKPLLLTGTRQFVDNLLLDFVSKKSIVFLFIIQLVNKLANTVFARFSKTV